MPRVLVGQKKPVKITWSHMQRTMQNLCIWRPRFNWEQTVSIILFAILKGMVVFSAVIMSGPYPLIFVSNETPSVDTFPIVFLKR